MNKNHTVHIGLPKGRFLTKSQALEKALRERVTRKGKPLHFYYLKARDIPNLIFREKLSYGVTCDEWVAESGVALRSICDTGWCYSKITLISQAEDITLTNESQVASPFPHLASAYFEKQDKHPVVEEVTGSGEFLVPFVYDMAVDVVETGNTLAKLGLKPVGEPLLLSSTRVWGSHSVSNDEIECLFAEILGQKRHEQTSQY
ncbi:TPA: hypothetical protein N2G30_000753 [Salmonella enterica]|nr:hypothetical protein [Salmonella enterica]